MVNGLGVLGWGVGGIEAEASMLGEPISMLVPQVVGFKLSGRLPAGSTGTDLVLTVTERLRALGVVGKFVEFFGHGLAGLPLADRATIANMAPECGSTCNFFPVDDETLRYLELTARPAERIALVEAYARAQGLFHDPDQEPTYTQVVELDLGDVEPSLAGPRRPQDRVPLTQAGAAFQASLAGFGIGLENTHDDAVAASFPASDPPADIAPGHEPAELTAPVAVAPALPASAPVELDGERFQLEHGSVVIAAITSCTNTSNPAVMVGAGLLAQRAVERGLTRRPWVKSSLAPGSKVVTEYLERAGLTPHLDALGFNLVGYGCTTCIGNSGPLPEPISQAVADNDLVVCAVLSGNRNFEARIHSEVKANYLASPPLVVAYALAGRMDIDLTTEPLGQDRDGNDVYLHELWPTPEEIQTLIQESLRRDMFARTYADVFAGDERWNALETPSGEPLRLGSRLHVRPPAALLRRHGPRARGNRRHRRRPLPRHGRRLRDDRPHLARRLDPSGQPGRPLPDRQRGRATGLQLLRLATREPRGDGARHVRERPPAQPARPGKRGHRHRAPAEWRGDLDLRGGASATAPRACR